MLASALYLFCSYLIPLKKERKIFTEKFKESLHCFIVCTLCPAVILLGTGKADAMTHRLLGILPQLIETEIHVPGAAGDSSEKNRDR